MMKAEEARPLLEEALAELDSAIPKLYVVTGEQCEAERSIENARDHLRAVLGIVSRAADDLYINQTGKDY